MLVDYKYYVDEYEGSSIPQSSFKKYSKNASSKVNYYTSNKIVTIDEDVKNTVCEIAEFLYSQDLLIFKQDNDTSPKASETVGPHSITYVNKSNLQASRILSSQDKEKECYRICCEHLTHTGLMNRGAR